MRFPWVRRVVSPGSSKTHTLENPSWTSSAATWHKRKQRISQWLHKAQRTHHRHHSYQNATLRHYSPYEINLPRFRKVDSMHGSESSEFLRIATENPSLNFTICFKKDYEYTALYLKPNTAYQLSSFQRLSFKESSNARSSACQQLGNRSIDPARSNCLFFRKQPSHFLPLTENHTGWGVSTTQSIMM